MNILASATGGSGIVPPPTSDMHPNMAFWWLVMAGFVVYLIGALIYCVFDARRTRSPLLLMLMIGGATIFPFVAEPLVDILLLIAYPVGPPGTIHVMGRPLGLIAPALYAGLVSTVCYLTYRMVVAGSRCAPSLCL